MVGTKGRVGEQQRQVLDGVSGGPLRGAVHERPPMTVAAFVKGIVLLATVASLGACSSVFDKGGKFGVASTRLASYGETVPKGGGYYMVGQPYRIAGKTYIPREDPQYSKVGIASWYGEDFHGRQTANGEIYDLDAVTAAHPTLPLPSYARVTNLENGRSITVRINDRGPFVDNRIIDVSRTVARMLDFANAGTAQVRVDYVGPASLEANDEKTLLASYREPGGSPGLLASPTIQVAQAQPASAVRPPAASVSLAPAPTPRPAQPNGAVSSDPLAPLIMRAGLSYAPRPALTPAQEAADALARADLSALLAISAQKKAAELKLRGAVPQ
jgi:rare lipoprotein A